MLGLDHFGVLDLHAVGAWAPALGWLVVCAGGALLIFAVAEAAWRRVTGATGARTALSALESEAERNLSALVDDERVYLNWLFRANMQRFPCDYWDDGIEGLRNKQIIYVPEHSTGGVYLIRDSVWKHRDELIAAWGYLPSAFKPLGLMTESERAERARI